MSTKVTTNYISENWFYILDENSPWVIDISENIIVNILIINTKKPCTINIFKNSKVNLFWFFHKSCPSKILINQLHENSNLDFKWLFLNYESDFNTFVKSYVSSNNSISNVNLIWLVKDKKLSIDSSIEIESWFKWVEWHLDMENIFLWKNWSVKSLPTLLVRSDDVKASHSSKTHSLDEMDKFYLKSRWLDEKESVFLLVESYFFKIFSGLKDVDSGVYEEVYESFLGFSR